MYTLLDIVADAEARASGSALKDRMRFAKFIEVGERFAAEHGLIVGGAAATRLLCGTGDPAPTLDSFQYDFFSPTAPSHARALGDAMWQADPDGLGHYTTVLSKVPGYLLTVMVDSRPLFTVTSLPTHRGIRMADVVVPSECPAQFARDKAGQPLRLQCAGPEIQLISVYAALCNPARASDWDQLLETEEKLRALFGREIRKKLAKAVGRAALKMALAAPLAGRPVAARAYALLRDKYATGPGRVLVGPAAIALLAGTPVPGEERLQVASAGSLEAEAAEIIALMKAAGLEGGWRIDDPKIPTDPRLRRLTVHLAVGDRREPILDVYNSAEFDLVPYVTHGAVVGGRRAAEARRGKDRRDKDRREARRDRRTAVNPIKNNVPAALKIGTPFVLMRYRLVDIWTMQVLLRMGAINAGFVHSVLNGMLAGYDTIVAYTESVLGTDTDTGVETAAALLLPTESYIGRLEEPELALKRASAAPRGKVQFYPPYFPAAARSSHGFSQPLSISDGDTADDDQAW